MTFVRRENRFFRLETKYLAMPGKDMAAFACLCCKSEDGLHFRYKKWAGSFYSVSGLHYLCIKNKIMPEPKRTGRRPAARSKVNVPQEDAYGHVQPQAIEFEEAVLGALMIEKDAYSLISEILRPESFYDYRHQLIYEAVRTLNLQQKPVDIITVAEHLRTMGKLEEAGGPFYITQLSGKVASSAHIEYHARIIAQKALARELITFTSMVQTKAFDETVDVDDLMQEAEGKLFEISQQNMKKDYTQINPVINAAYDLLQKAAARSDGLSGLSCGFEKLDKMTSGWQNSDLVIIAARPAMGKTAFVLSMAKKMAVDMKIPCAMFSLEMSNVQLVNRMIVNVCEIPGEKIKSGQLAPYEWVQLDSKITQLYDAPLYLDDTPALSVFELRTKARRLVREHGVKIIMIDYLQLMNASGMSFGSRQEEVSTISRSLKGLAKELNIPIIALSQLNRGVESREGIDGKRPQLSDLRESGAIEQDADMVCFIHRPEYYKIFQDEKGRDLHGMAEIIIAKHRNGAVGDVLLKFRGEYARFQDPDEDAYVPMPGEAAVFGSAANGSGAPLPSSDMMPPQEASSPFGAPAPDGPLPF